MQMTHPSGTLGSNPVSAVNGVCAGVPMDGVPGMSGMKLTDLKVGTVARVVSVAILDSSGSDLGRRLAELGFLPGERLRIVARGPMGREPIAVRIGTGTFALRRFEAECVRVSPERFAQG